MGVEVKRYERVRELETYFDELRSYKPLSKREELELAYKMRGGDKTALEKLIKANLKFVVKIAKQYRKYDVNFADLISEGNMGLLKAAEKFDPSKNTKFISYAVWWIRVYIQEYINSNKDAGIVTDNDYAVNDDKKGDFVVPANTINSEFEEEMIDAQSRYASIEELMDSLEKREKKILIMYFGLYGNKENTLDEIGQEMKLTKERVRQIKDKALVKMKCNALLSDEFETFRSLA